MKTIRLLYPDYVSGGLEQYFFGANLMSHILPENENQPIVKVEITPPNRKEKLVTDGIYGKNEVIAGIKNATEKIEKENPDKIITIGGNCLVSQAPFEYLHGKYNDLGIIWIDAHPDVSTVNDDYPNAHAMVLGSLMGYGDNALSSLMKNKKFKADEILYVGLQEIHDYQKKFLDETCVNYKIQTDEFLSDKEILSFIERFENIVVHFDIDVLDENLFHSTYFANPDLVGDGSGGGKMTLDKLGNILHCITENSNVVGFTIAEYLPFDEYKLHKLFSKIRMFTE
ncbi:arginase family protein [Clostridioides difficile]|nr:arginase family protein [Clostridioides difficile]